MIIYTDGDFCAGKEPTSGAKTFNFSINFGGINIPCAKFKKIITSIIKKNALSLHFSPPFP